MMRIPTLDVDVVRRAYAAPAAGDFIAQRVNTTAWRSTRPAMRLFWWSGVYYRRSGLSTPSKQRSMRSGLSLDPTMLFVLSVARKARMPLLTGNWTCLSQAPGS